MQLDTVSLTHLLPRAESEMRAPGLSRERRPVGLAGKGSGSVCNSLRARGRGHRTPQASVSLENGFDQADLLGLRLNVMKDSEAPLIKYRKRPGGLLMFKKDLNFVLYVDELPTWLCGNWSLEFICSRI